MASGSSDHVQNLVEKNVLNHFIELMSSPHLEIVDYHGGQRGGGVEEGAVDD